MFIVYREKFKSYTETGGGYFVKYKNKIEYEFSENWIEAKKYKTIGSALHRMGIEIKPGIDTIEKFIKSNSLDDLSINRDNVLNDVLGENKNINILFKKGRVDKVGINGEFLGSAEKEIIEYIEMHLDKNRKRNDKKMKMINEIVGVSSDYIIETKEGEDFLEGF
jgi:hypothetical protein